jgi:UrcA family protein
MNTMITPSRIRTVIGTALCGAFVFSFAALPAAADSFVAPTVIVRFADLDVSHPQGAAMLYARIRAAAMDVCSPFDGAGLGATLHRDACVNKAIVGAVTRVNSPALSAVYSAHAEKDVPTHLTSLQYSLTTSSH